MIEFLRQRLRGIPWSILLVVYLLIGIGLGNLYSATGAATNPYRFNDQINWVLLGTGSLIFWGIILDLKSIERLTIPGYILICIMLLAVDLSGQIAKGSQRWLVLGPVRIQPSELAKFIVILITARSFGFTKGIHEFSLLSLWRQILFVGIPFLLILGQPDLGTAGLVLIISLTQLFFVRIEWKSIALVCASGLTAAAVAWNFFLYDYQKLRILNFLNPMSDPKGSGYHSIQSMIAVGSGGLWGRGFMQGTQGQLSFLPERHTDFIFSVLAEEHGFVGCVFIFALYLILILLVFQVVERAREPFAAMVALGVAGFLMSHFLINVTMVVGLFPVVGVPLSLVSYGGSHMVTVLSCIGLLVAIERKRVYSTSSSG